MRHPGAECGWTRVPHNLRLSSAALTVRGKPIRNVALGLGSTTSATIPAPAPMPEPPLKPEHLVKWKAEQARNTELTRQGLPPVSSGMACLPEGMPGMMQATFPMEVLESPGQVTIIQEAYNQVRRIYLNEKALAPEDAEPRFSGHSVGTWEGETFVVRTVGVKDYVRLRNTPHSMNMRITERIRLVNDDFMENQVTVEDPEYLTKALDVDVDVQAVAGLQDSGIRLRGQPLLRGSRTRVSAASRAVSETYRAREDSYPLPVAVKPTIRHVPLSILFWNR